jgi:hypothetical protein
VEREHRAEVDVRAHWLYLLGVLGIGTVAMLLFIAWLGAG